jgi:imidazolonepropionase-like amidohydrolase
MRTTIVAALAGALLLAPAQAQDAPPAEAPPLAIVNARVAGTPGPVTILISKGKIRAVAGRARPLPGMQALDVRGARVVPGRIDPWTSVGSPHPNGRASDGYDVFDEAAERALLRGGVTTVVLTPFRSPSMSGLATAIKVKPGVPLGERTLVEEVALCASLGLGSVGPTKRAGQVDGLRRTFLAARAYRDSFEAYEEKLKEYVEALEKAGAGGKGAKGKPKGAPKKPPAKPKPGAKPDPKKKDSGPKKPKRPRKNAAKELVLKVLSRELPLRVEAHRLADLISLLELQEQFGFELILEGATEAHRIADVLAEREVPVVIGQVLGSRFTTAKFPLQATPANAALLAAAGVEVVIGSDSAAGSPRLADNAAAAASAGLDQAAAHEAITHGVARMLGLGDRLGKVAVGYEADLVVLREGPLGLEVPALVVVDGAVLHREVSK